MNNPATVVNSDSHGLFNISIFTQIQTISSAASTVKTWVVNSASLMLCESVLFEAVTL